MNPNDQECFRLLEDSSETVKPQTTSDLHTQLSLCPPPPTGALFYHLQFEGLQLLFHTAQRVINDFICSKLPYELTGILRANCCHVRTPRFHYLPRGGREEEETVKKCTFLKRKVGAKSTPIRVISRELSSPLLNKNCRRLPIRPG